MNLAFAAGLALLPRASWSARLWADAFWTVASLGCAAELLRVSRRLPPSREKSAWMWFGIGSFAWFLGMPAWSWLELVRNEVAPIAQVADLGFLAMAPCFVIGTTYLRAPPGRWRPPWRCWVCELAIAVLLIVLLGGVLLYRPIARFSGPPLHLAASLTRAAFYSAAALFAVMSIANGEITIPSRVASLLFASFGAFAGLYVAYAYTLVTDQYQTGGWLDAIWIVAFSLLFLAGFERDRLGPDACAAPAKRESWPRWPHSMVWLWATLLISLGAGAGTFWSTLSGEVRFLFVMLLFLTLFVAIRWEILLSDERGAHADLLDAVRWRDDFLVLAAHEFRTPLMPLKLHLSMVRRVVEGAPLEAKPSEQIRSSLTTAERQLDRVEGLVEDLIDVARIESGRLTLNREDVDLGKVVLDVIERFQDSLRQASCQLSLETESLTRGRWDRLRIEQVVTKLLANAIKFGAGKPIEIRTSAQGDRVRLEVRDHGIGIAREDQRRIFGKHERATPVSAYGGLGLGLFLAQQIVLRHGGTFLLESEPGEGAKFVVELPLVPPPGS